MKPGFYQFAHVAFQCFGALLALTFGVKASAEGIRATVPYLSGKFPFFISFIVRDSATIVAFGLVLFSAFCTHFLVRDSVLLHSLLHQTYSPHGSKNFLWRFCLGLVLLDAFFFYCGISEFTLFGAEYKTMFEAFVARLPAITMTLLYLCMFPVYAFINLFLSLKAKG